MGATDYLLIDDNATFARLLLRGFARQGLALDWAGGCDRALAGQKDYAGIILDLNLEGESGLRLLPDLKRHYPSSKIIVLTGYASIPTAVKAVKLGATNYLPKPAKVGAILGAFEGQGGAEPGAFEPPSLKRLTWEHIQYRLQANDGNISATARDLKMHRRTLQRMLKKHAVKR
jgi:two-component system response regulator RegA